MQLSATLVNILAICLFELVFMPVMDMLAVQCAAHSTRLKLGRRGECRLFESPLPIQAVPGYFSSRLLFGFFQVAKVVSVLALILFETFGSSVEVTAYVQSSGTAYKRGFTQIEQTSREDREPVRTERHHLRDTGI